jgi:hypothetical protein
MAPSGTSALRRVPAALFFLDDLKPKFEAHPLAISDGQT